MNTLNHFPDVLTTATETLLVSVRNLDEAEMVAKANVDVIDFKEPSSGALAPVAPEIWDLAASRFANLSLSAALGESDTAVDLACQVPAAFRFAKVGPSRTFTSEHLGKIWNQLPLPPRVELVPVAYADNGAAECPDAMEILQLTKRQGRSRMLVDTFVKDGRGLLNHLSTTEIANLLREARSAGIWIALAGSLTLGEVKSLRDQKLIPNCWGVRGDVCIRPAETRSTIRRTGAIDRTRVAMWRNAIARTDSSGIQPCG